MRAVLTALVFAVIAVLFNAGTASAHSELLSSDPAADAVVTAPLTEVSLVFNQTIQADFAFLTVTGADGTQWAAPTPKVEGDRVGIAVEGELPRGTYVVGYRVVSEDGHPITGTYNFTMDADPQKAQTPEVSAPAAAPSDTPRAETPTADATATTDSQDQGRTVTWILGAGAAGLLVAGLLVAFRGGARKKE